MPIWGSTKHKLVNTTAIGDGMPAYQRQWLSLKFPHFHSPRVMLLVLLKLPKAVRVLPAKINKNWKKKYGTQNSHQGQYPFHVPCLPSNRLLAPREHRPFPSSMERSRRILQTPFLTRSSGINWSFPRMTPPLILSWWLSISLHHRPVGPTSKQNQTFEPTPSGMADILLAPAAQLLPQNTHWLDLASFQGS